MGLTLKSTLPDPEHQFLPACTLVDLGSRLTEGNFSRIAKSQGTVSKGRHCSVGVSFQEMRSEKINQQKTC